MNASFAAEVAKYQVEIWENGARFDGTRPIPTTLTPYYFESSKYEAVGRDSQLVLAAIEVVADLYCREPEIRARFPELARLEPYILRTPPPNRRTHLARFDLVQATDGRLMMVEPNADCPGGMTNAAIIHHAFRRSAFYDRSVAEVPQPSEDPRSFLKMMRSISGKANPRVGFVWSRIQPIKNDIQTFFNAAATMPGWPAPYIGPVQDLTVATDGTLLADGVPLDATFTKIDTTLASDGTIHWFAWDKDISEAAHVLNSLASGSFLTVSGLPSMMVAENKRVMALLFEDAVRSYFSDEERQAVDRLVARSSSLDGLASSTLWSRAEVERNKDAFVLKTPIDTRGRGVFIGRDCSQSDWELLVKDAAQGKAIVQEYIAPKMDALLLDSGERFRMATVIALFFYAGQATGLLGRSAKQDIVNVGNGGVIRPTLIVDQLPSYFEL